MVVFVHPFCMKSMIDAENIDMFMLKCERNCQKSLILLTHMNRRSYNKGIRYMNDCSYVQLKR